MPEPDRTPGIDRMVRQLFVEFTGRPFRSARFLEKDERSGVTNR